VGSVTPGLVAIVDDEPHLRETVAFALGRDGYRVQTYADGAQAWEAFSRELPDLVVLDILMPRMDGLELCRRLRARSERVPILFLSSRDEEFDRVLGLEIGADDYLGKPFSMRELRARVKVLFRRLAQTGSEPSGPDEAITVGRLGLDLRKYEAKWDGRTVDLTVTEFLLLTALAKTPGHVKSRRQLMEQSYAHDAYVSDRTIDSHIKRIRRKFSDLDDDFGEIETVYGIGYRYRSD
jgi:DNA-binding response OmpR family regulator